MKGFISIQWNCDSVDWKEEGAEIEYSRIKENLKPGSILLFHNNAKYTPENLEKVLKYYKIKEYKFVKVGDLIYNEDYTIEKMELKEKNNKNLLEIYCNCIIMEIQTCGLLFL